MRIDCEQCGAAYSIDDALITERGVRAQCPKCGHQKVVKKAAAAGSTVVNPGGGGAAPSQPPQSAGPSNPFATSSPPAPSAAATAAAAANPFATSASGAVSNSPFGAPSGGGGGAGGGLPPNPFAPPAGASPFGPPSGAPQQPQQPPPLRPSAAPPSPFGAPPGAASNPFGPPSGGAGGAAPSPFGPPPGPPPAGPSASAPFGNPFAAPSAPPGPPGAGAGMNPGDPQFGFGSPFAQLTDPTSSQTIPGAGAAGGGAGGFTPPPGPGPGPGPGPSGGGGFSLNPFGAAPAPAPSGGGSPFGASTDPFAGVLGNPGGGGGGGAAAPDPFGAMGGGAPAPSPFGGPPAPAPSPFGGGASNPFGGGGGGGPPSNPPSANPFGNFGGGPPSPTTSDPFGALGSSTSPAGSGALATGAPGTGGLTSGGAGAAPGFGGGSGAPVNDPFAKLDLNPSRDAGPPIAPPGRWRVKTAAGMDAEVDLAQLRDLVRSGQVGPNDEAAPLGEPLKSVRSQPLLSVSTPQGKQPQGARVAGARVRSGPSFGRILGMLLIVGVVGGGIGLYITKPELFEGQSDAGVNPLRRAKPTWQKQFPDVGGTSTEHVASARKLMRLDNAAAYRKADDELRQALLLDVSYLPAIAAWVENFANLPAVKADLEGASLAQEAIAYAAKREPDNAEVKRAQGALKLALGEVDAAQKALTEAQQISPDAETLLVLAKSHLDRNPQDAMSLVSQVRQKDPSLKHALVVEGAAQRRLGEFKLARETLNSRLTDDPANTGALKELAKLELDIGNPTEAILALTRLLDAEDKDVDAHLMRAKISYQILETAGGLAQAEGYLDQVIRNHDTTAGELLLPVLSHAAYVKAELGNLDEALKLGERARATDGGFAPALFVLGRVYALKGNMPEAKKALQQAVLAAQSRDNFYTEVCRAELARLQAASGEAPDAIRNYEQAIDYDPRYARAHFGLAATYMSTDRSTQAMTIMRRAFENDPHFERERISLTDYPTPRRDLIAFADIFKATKVPASDESLGALKLAAEGMIRYHAGQLPEAETLEKRALAEDRFNLFALLYLGVIELGDGRANEAKKHLKLAVETTGTPHAMMRLYLGRVELETGDLDQAEKRLKDLIDQEPTLVQANYSLAMLYRQKKLEAQARDELKKVLLKDQDFIPAKRALAQSQ